MRDEKIKQTIIFFMALIIMPVFIFMYPQKAEAIPVEVVAETAPTAITRTVAAETTAGATAAAQTKEYGLDPAAWMAARVMLRAFTQEIVNWINTGFQGKPLFVTDWRQFFLDAAGEAGGVF